MKVADMWIEIKRMIWEQAKDKLNICAQKYRHITWYPSLVVVDWVSNTTKNDVTSYAYGINEIYCQFNRMQVANTFRYNLLTTSTALVLANRLSYRASQRWSQYDVQ